MAFKKNLSTGYEDVRDQIMGILKGPGIARKVLLAAGLAATTVGLIVLIIQALYWVILFLAGLVLLSAALRRSSSS